LRAEHIFLSYTYIVSYSS